MNFLVWHVCRTKLARNIFSRHEIAHGKCSEIVPEIFEPFFVGRKNPTNFPPNFPPKTKNYRRASARAQGEKFPPNFTYTYIVTESVLRWCKFSCRPKLAAPKLRLTLLSLFRNSFCPNLHLSSSAHLKSKLSALRCSLMLLQKSHGHGLLELSWWKALPEYYWDQNDLESLNGGLANGGLSYLFAVVHDCLRLSSFCDKSSS